MNEFERKTRHRLYLKTMVPALFVCGSSCLLGISPDVFTLVFVAAATLWLGRAVYNGLRDSFVAGSYSAAHRFKAILEEHTDFVKVKIS